MKIALFSGRALPKLGGVEVVLDSLARQFETFGHQVQVIAPRRKFWSYHNDSGNSYSVFRYPPHFFSKKLFVKSYLPYLRKALKRSKADILHIHEVWPHAYLAALLKQEGLDIPLVLTSHGSDAVLETARYKNKSILSKARWALGQVDVGIANSPWMKENFRKMHPEMPIREISNGVFEAPKLLKRKPNGNIVYLGRLTERKGVNILIEAVSKLSHDSFNKLYIGGWGKKERELKRQVENLNLQEKVVFLGPVMGDAKHSLLSSADIVVIPTLDWEACSMVALEAFSYGLQVVASDVEGIRHFFEKEPLGSLVKPGSVLDLAGAISESMLKVKRGEFDFSRLKSFSEKYYWDVIAAQHLELYQELLVNRKNVNANKKINTSKNTNARLK